MDEIEETVLRFLRTTRRLKHANECNCPLGSGHIPKNVPFLRLWGSGHAGWFSTTKERWCNVYKGEQSGKTDEAAQDK